MDVQLPGRHTTRGFTLLELLVTCAIVVLLVGLTLPALEFSRGRARSFSCQMNIRGIAFDFALFADEELHDDRGDDEDLYGDRRFSLETFIESQYGLDEFWSDAAAQSMTLPKRLDMLRCPEIEPGLVLHRDTPCRSGALSPTALVSYGFNARLFRAEGRDQAGRPVTRPVLLTSRVLHRGDVPLIMDVDGEAAAARNAVPSFIAPPLDSAGPYANDRAWFPGIRHGGRANVGFIDGHVESSDDPGAESGWRWDHQPR